MVRPLAPNVLRTKLASLFLPALLMPMLLIPAMAPAQSQIEPRFLTAAPACFARVTELRPVTQYDHLLGAGFLAVRAGPGSDFAQTGELYLGDAVTIGARQGNWYQVACTQGRCLNPLWGPPAAQGWAYGRHLILEGNCP